jgi:hypothetical protein
MRTMIRKLAILSLWLSALALPIHAQALFRLQNGTAASGSSPTLASTTVNFKGGSTASTTQNIGTATATQIIIAHVSSDSSGAGGTLTMPGSTSNLDLVLGSTQDVQNGGEAIPSAGTGFTLQQTNSQGPTATESLTQTSTGTATATFTTTTAGTGAATFTAVICVH